MICHNRKENVCQVASDWASGLVVQVTDQACKVCQGCPVPMQLNRVTVSLAVETTRQQKPDDYKAILARSIPYLDKVGNMEAVARFGEATTNWMAQGCPVRSDSEVAKVLQTCKSCEHYKKNTEDSGTCQLCGCAVNMYGGFINKAKRSTEHCPINKW